MISRSVKHESGYILILRAVGSVVIALCGFSHHAVAQSGSGSSFLSDDTIQPSESADSSDIDRIDLATLKMRLHIPLASFPQRGQLHLGFYVDYSSVVLSDSVISWNAGGTTIEPDFIAAPGNTYDVEGQENIVDAAGVHLLGLLNSTSTANAYTAIDGSGYQMTCIAGSGACTILDRSGIAYSQTHSPGSSPVWNVPLSIVDPNGNTISYTPPASQTDPAAETGSLTDSMSRTIPMPPDIGQFSCCVYGGSPSSQCLGIHPATEYDWVVPGSGGSPATYKICLTTIEVLEGFTSGYYDFNEIQSIQLPDGRSWQFQYDPTYGDLTSVIFPTGDEFDYTWQWFPLEQLDCLHGASAGLARVISTRSDAIDNRSTPWMYAFTVVNATGGVSTIDDVGSTPTDLYSPQTPGEPYGVIVTDPDGNQTLHVMKGIGNSCTYREVETDTYVGTIANGTLSNHVTTQYGYDSVQAAYVSAKGLPYSVHVWKTDVKDNWSEVQKDYVSPSIPIQYFIPAEPFPLPGTPSISTSGMVGFDQVSEERIYDESGLVRKTDTVYQWQNNSAYLSANLLDLPSSTSISGPSGTVASTTLYNYDEFLAASSISTQHTGPPNGLRGNLTTVSRSLNTSGGYVSTHTSWYDTGMPYQMFDGRGNRAATISYSSDYAGAYPTSVVNALNQPPTSATYDFNTGQVASITDPNSNTTHICYASNGRIQAQLTPGGGGSTYSYDDAGKTVTVATVISGSNSGSCPGTISGNTVMQTMATYDGLGRTTQSALLNSPDGSEVTKVNSFDSFGRSTGTTTYDAQNNPYVDASVTYDMFGRVLSTLTDKYCYDTIPYAGNSSPCWLGGAGYQLYLSQYHSKNVVDADGHPSQQYTDVLGRLRVVFEPNDAGYLNIETDYDYDALGNVTTIKQWGAPGLATPRIRTFTYDSLSRLVCSSNPENSQNACPASATSAMPSGVTTYAYDANGNVTTKTDARGVTINYSPSGSPIDALNRVTEKTYSDGVTPPVFYSYDQATNGIGRPYEEDTGSLTNPITRRRILAYDPMGRITSEQQCVWNSCTNNTPHAMSYGYDQAGNVISSTDGLGALSFAMAYNSANRLNVVTDVNTWNDSQHPNTLFSSPTYGPVGPYSVNIGDHLQFHWTYDSFERVTGQTVTTR